MTDNVYADDRENLCVELQGLNDDVVSLPAEIRLRNPCCTGMALRNSARLPTKRLLPLYKKFLSWTDRDNPPIERSVDVTGFSTGDIRCLEVLQPSEDENQVAEYSFCGTSPVVYREFLHGLRDSLQRGKYKVRWSMWEPRCTCWFLVTKTTYEDGLQLVCHSIDDDLLFQIPKPGMLLIPSGSLSVSQATFLTRMLSLTPVQIRSSRLALEGYLS